jgi:hypothetical protein
LILLKYLFKLKDLISRALKKLNGLLGIKTFPKFSTSIGFFLQRSKKTAPLRQVSILYSYAFMEN